jgi:hypothetical protein
MIGNEKVGTPYQDGVNGFVAYRSSIKFFYTLSFL